MEYKITYETSNNVATIGPGFPGSTTPWSIRDRRVKENEVLSWAKTNFSNNNRFNLGDILIRNNEVIAIKPLLIRTFDPILIEETMKK